MQQAVIYAFRSPGSGGVYIGKHTVAHGALDQWPRRGTGCLPDGYRGSGVAVANFHRRHGAAVQWRILARVTGTRDDVNRIERRAIRLARSALGRLCVNSSDGGDGQTADFMRRLWQDPDRMAGVARKHLDPEFAARRDAQFAEFRAKPRTPDHKAKLAAHLARWNATPEAKAHRAAALAAAHSANKARAATPEGAAFLAMVRSTAHTPEAIAKCKATKLRNFIRAANARNRARRESAVRMTMRDRDRDRVH